jgi:outer membrane scaffolding protein for murein synthesis (MipA/OmpV family)
MRKGEGYWSNKLLFVNSYHHGLTDNIAVGGGFEIITTLFALTPTPFANLKASFSASKNFHYGVGAFAGTIIGQITNETIYYTLPYGMITVGDRNSNLTFGGGAGFVNDESVSYYSLSGTLRLSPKFGPVSNNYLVIDQEGFGGFIGFQGIRIIGKSITLDLALAFTPGGLDAGIIIPFAGFGLKI